jgi:hypothetical protein
MYEKPFTFKAGQGAVNEDHYTNSTEIKLAKTTLAADKKSVTFEYNQPVEFYATTGTTNKPLTAVQIAEKVFHLTADKNGSPLPNTETEICAE